MGQGLRGADGVLAALAEAGPNTTVHVSFQLSRYSDRSCIFASNYTSTQAARLLHLVPRNCVTKLDRNWRFGP